jgi:hypothetical protein
VASNGGAEGIELAPAYSAGNNFTFHINRSGSAYVTNSQVASAHIFRISSDATEAARIDSSGRLLVGTPTVISSNWGGTAALLQVAKNDFLPIGFYTYSDSAGENGYCPYVELHRARGTQASPTVVGSGDDLGLINFYGHDGSTFIRSALIKAVVDGTPGANDMPGRLVFSTTADGASSPTERLRITSAGLVGIGTSSPSSKLDVTVPVNNPSTGSPDAGSFITARGNTTTVGYGPSFQLANNSGAKETFWRISAVTASGNNGDLVFNGYNGGADYPERLRITAGGLVGIGTTGPGEKLHVSGGKIKLTGAAGGGAGGGILSGEVAGELHIQSEDYTGASFADIVFDAGNGSGSYTERARIDSNGRLLVGTSSVVNDYWLGGAQTIESAKDSLNGITVYAATGFSPGHGSLLGLHRARGTMASPAIVANGDTLGAVYFSSYDGSTYLNSAAIDCVVDGTPGANDTPGRLVFSTTADGASSPTERLRITSAGLVGIGTSSPNVNYKVTIEGNSSAVGPAIAFSDTAASPNNYNIGINGSKNFFIDGPSAASFDFVLDSSGRVGIGTSSPQSQLQVLDQIRVSNSAQSQGSIVLGDGSSTVFNVGIARWNGTTNAAGAGGIGYFSQGAGNIGGHYFYTGDAAAGSQTARMIVNPAGNVGIGTTSPAYAFVVSAAGASGIEFGPAYSGTANLIQHYSRSGFVYVDAVNDAAQHRFQISGTERARIDSSGRLLVGTSSVRTTGWTTQGAGEIFQELTNYGGITCFTNSTNEEGTYFTLGKSRGTAVGSNTIVQNNDRLGGINFQGADGSASISAASIHAFVDGTPGANDMPGRLVFSVTPDGSASPTEAMRIDSQRNAIIGTTTTNIGTGFASKTNRLLVGNPTGVGGGIGAFGFTSALSGTVSFVVGNNGAVRVTIYSTANSASARIGHYIIVGLNKGAGNDPVVQSTETNSPNWTFSYSNNSGDTLVTVTAPAAESNFQGMRVIVEPLGS